jgi:hypothetical protein
MNSVTALVTSQHGRYAVQVEGLAVGKSGIYQHVTFGAAGTYVFSFSVAYRELVGNSWGYGLEVVVVSGDLTIVEKLAGGTVLFPL